jgi:hypothetical protein
MEILELFHREFVAPVVVYFVASVAVFRAGTWRGWSIEMDNASDERKRPQPESGKQASEPKQEKCGSLGLLPLVDGALKVGGFL